MKYIRLEKNNKSGITLIALVVTIIVLLILAEISVMAITGQNGIMSRAAEAKEKTEKANEEEQVKLAVNDAKTIGNGIVTQSSINEALTNQLGTGITGGSETVGAWIYKGKTGTTYIITSNGEIVKEVSVSTKKREAQAIDSVYADLTWEKLSRIADAISVDENIDSSIEQVNIDLNGVEYNIAVGDTMEVEIDGETNKFTARILEFKHDTISNTTDKAGISFEFIDYLMIKPINASATNENGWEECDLRKNVFTEEYISKFSNGKFIKTVEKPYVKQTWSTTEDKKVYDYTIKYSNDKLWLLSVSEIWKSLNFSARPGAADGIQYKYYFDNSENADKIKCTEYISQKNNWWTRSSIRENSEQFGCVNYMGGAWSISSNTQHLITPGFAI